MEFENQTSLSMTNQTNETLSSPAPSSQRGSSGATGTRETTIKNLVEIGLTTPSTVLSILVIIIIVRNKKMHTSGYMLMASLSVTSILYCVNRILLYPVAMFHEVTQFPRDYYKAVGAIQTVVVNAQRLHITLITVNRLVAVVFYLKYNDIFTVRRTATVIGAAWLLAIGLYSHFYSGDIWYEFQPTVQRWMMGVSGRQYLVWNMYGFVMNLIVGGISVLTIAVSYPVIIRSIRKRKRQVKDGPASARGPKKEEMSLLLQFGIISFFHFVVWFFEFAGSMLALTQGKRFDWITGLIYALLAVMNVCVDPYIYLIFNKAIRDDFLALPLCRYLKKSTSARDHEVTGGSNQAASGATRQATA